MESPHILMPREHEQRSEGIEQTQSDREHSARVEKRKQKTRAVEALEPSGSLVDDARVLFAAIELDPSSIQEPFGDAFKTGNEQLIVEYFKALTTAIQNAPPLREDVQAYDQAKKVFIAKMLQKHEERLRHQATDETLAEDNR